jgi:3-oxoacyl-[acyl-carrier-protein] synthase II
MRRNAVITGIGVVTGLGVGRRALWEGLIAGRSALGPISAFDASGFGSRLASSVRDFSAKDYVPKNYRKAVKVMARDTELAVAAARLAVEDAGLVTRGTLGDGAGGSPTYAAERMACQIGAGLIAAETEELSSALATARADAGDATSMGGVSMRGWGDAPDGGKGMENLQPLWLLKYLPNMLACHVTIIHGLEGPSNTITCSEASGLLSLGESCRVIERDTADLAFSGGAESKLNLMGLLRLELAGWLAHTPDGVDAASVVRPYADDAAGTLLGEAGGILILEERERARARGAAVYAEVVGFGAAQSVHADDARSRAWLGQDSDGLTLAIENALRDAGVEAGAIDLIAPGASAVGMVDRAEAVALHAVFGPRLKDIPLVCLPPMIGQSMAGQGSVMAAAAAMALREQTLPARVHGSHPAGGLLAGAAPSRPAELRHALVCSSSLGGQNAALVLRTAS